MILNKSKVLKLIQLLNLSIKNPKTSLNYKNHFTLLTSVVLSAQCTDVNVNNVTKAIYKKYFTPIHFVNLGIKKLRNFILTFFEGINIFSLIRPAENSTLIKYFTVQ